MERAAEDAGRIDRDDAEAPALIEAVSELFVRD
jgi:hypothetical protein